MKDTTVIVEVKPEIRDSRSSLQIFPIPRCGDVFRCVEISPLDEVLWAVLVIMDMIVWRWDSGTAYNPPPPVNLLAIGLHTCVIKVCMVENCVNRVKVTTVYELFGDIEKRRHMSRSTIWYTAKDALL